MKGRIMWYREYQSCGTLEACGALFIKEYPYGDSKIGANIYNNYEAKSGNNRVASTIVKNYVIGAISEERKLAQLAELYLYDLVINKASSGKTLDLFGEGETKKITHTELCYYIRRLEKGDYKVEVNKKPLSTDRLSSYIERGLDRRTRRERERGQQSSVIDSDLLAQALDTWRIHVIREQAARVVPSAPPPEPTERTPLMPSISTVDEYFGIPSTNYEDFLRRMGRN